jgi:ankyrin repeat protein
VLIKNGANINLKNSDGDTALNIALKFKNKEAAKIILNSNPSLSVKNNRQHNVLYIAA